MNIFQNIYEHLNLNLRYSELLTSGDHLNFQLNIRICLDDTGYATHCVAVGKAGWFITRSRSTDPNFQEHPNIISSLRAHFRVTIKSPWNHTLW